MGSNLSSSSTIRELVADLFTSLGPDAIDTHRLIMASRIRLIFVFPLLFLFCYLYLINQPYITSVPLGFKLWVALAFLYLIANISVNYLSKWPLGVKRIHYFIIFLELTTIQLMLYGGGVLLSPTLVFILVAVAIYRVNVDYHSALYTAALGGLMYIFTVLLVTSGILPHSSGLSPPVFSSIYHEVSVNIMNVLTVLIGIFLTFVITNYAMNKLLKSNNKLEESSTRDGLIGIPNRRYFDEHLVAEWHRARRSMTPLSTIMIDIDNFKAYNDTYGHLSGDECLRKVAASLQKGVKRPADVVARFGGEELAVLLPETTLEGAANLAENLRRQIEVLEILHQHSGTIGKVTISLGVACLVPGSSHSPEELLEHADKALYRAKHLGRNRVSVDFALPYHQQG